jgi:1-acyl-sn-glycerol-3-phosphate acyltransferase
VKWWWTLRSTVLWILSLVHFLVVGLPLTLWGFLVPTRYMDRPVRWFFRNILRIVGGRTQVRYVANYDAQTPALFICNHVNIFDPMVVFVSIPQQVRGMELASHFKIPVYGWMATKGGNIPVPSKRSKADVVELSRRIKESLDAGVSIIVFAEGHRTRDGHVAPFKRGIFQIARQWGVPIVPMSITGSYELKRYDSLMLKPASITVWLHERLQTAGLRKEDMDALRGRVHETISRPVEEAIRGGAWSQQLAAYRRARYAEDVSANRNEP